MSKRTSYSELLRDPRWQRKRLEVMQAANFACVLCGDATTTLNVHHIKYVKGRKPWEYEADELQCLCEPCHTTHHFPAPVNPHARDIALVGGPLDGTVIPQVPVPFPVVLVYETAAGETITIRDAWAALDVGGGNLLASHFLVFGHPTFMDDRYGEGKRAEVEAAWKTAPYPKLVGLYGWVLPGVYAAPLSTELGYSDPDMFLLRLWAVQSMLGASEFNETEWWIPF